MTPSDLSLFRFGRRYELRRGEGVEGEVRRRGFLRPRYEGEIAGRTWHFGKLGAPVSGIRDPEDRERASLALTERGRRLTVDDEPIPEGVLLRRSMPASRRPRIQASSLRLQPVGREDRRNVTVAELTEGDGDWPGSDPVVVEALGRLTICVIRVAEIDDRALRQFNRLT